MRLTGMVKREGRKMTNIVKVRSEVTFVLTFFVALSIFGMVLGGFVVNDYARARASVSWPIVEGVTLNNSFDRGFGPSFGQSDAVRYAYSFDGRTYQATRDRLFLGRFSAGGTPASAPGDLVDVYVDPDEPGFSVLRPGGAGLAFVLFSAFSGLCVFVGVGGIVWTFSEGAEELAADGLLQS